MKKKEKHYIRFKINKYEDKEKQYKWNECGKEIENL